MVDSKIFYKRSFLTLLLSLVAVILVFSFLQMLIISERQSVLDDVNDPKNSASKVERNKP